MAPLKGHKGYPFMDEDQQNFMEALRDSVQSGLQMTENNHSENEVRNIVGATELGIITYKEATEGLRKL